MGPRDSLARSCACSLSAHRGRFPRNGRTLSVVNPMGPRWGQGRALVDPSRPIRRRWAVATGPNGVVAQCVPSEKRKVTGSIPALATRICAGQRLFWWCWGRWRSRVSAKIRRRLSVRRRRPVSGNGSVRPKSQAIRGRSGDISSPLVRRSGQRRASSAAYRHQRSPSIARHNVEDIDKASHPAGPADIVRSAIHRVRVGARR